MKIVKQSWKWNGFVSATDLLRQIEIAGRTCYKSEEKITSDSSKEFVRKMLASGHHAMIEFAMIPPVKVITDRGVSHEIVRHRLFSYAQESTRYCNYGKDKFGNEITVVLPVWFMDDYATTSATLWSNSYHLWLNATEAAEGYYMNLLSDKQSPQQARSVLPNSLKTEINICGNAREWRHFFKLRCSKAAHPQMRELARDMLYGFATAIPILFDDLYEQYAKESFGKLIGNIV